MADYKEMYLELSRATEKAIRLLIEAQQHCEERYLSSSDSPIKLLQDKVTNLQETSPLSDK